MGARLSLLWEEKQKADEECTYRLDNANYLSVVVGEKIFDDI